MTPADFSASLLPKHRPPLDPGFVPPALWNRAYRQLARTQPEATTLRLAIAQPGGEVSHYETPLLPHNEAFGALNLCYAERLLKFLLWARGGSKAYFSGPTQLALELRRLYRPQGARAFDANFLGERIYLEAFELVPCREEELPPARAQAVAAGGYLEGCRLGFDLGGSDRKAAAVENGKVVFSEEIKWDPYFEQDADYHVRGITDSLRRAAARLPRVDAIGGSAAGVYVDNEPRVASLFRGVPEEDFAKKVRPLFQRIAAEWGVPLTVVNDGDVTALAAAQMLGERRRGGVLGLACGTSLAAGYVSPGGQLKPWLNELAFVPVDYRASPQGGHVDEWSGDAGTGVRYLSQQALPQLDPDAAFGAAGTPLPQRLEQVQKAMAEGSAQHPIAAEIYRSYGVYLGYTLAHLADFYDFRHVLVLGRVLSGPGGDLVLEAAGDVLRDEFPQLEETLEFIVPDETFKRHGQSIAAASLAKLDNPNPTR